MIINNNMMAKNSHRMMTINASTMGKSTEKLSSGLRVNRAADDAAGLSISEKMRAQIRGLTQASRNGQDAISVVQTAEGALDEAHNILQRMRQLAVQSANDSNVKEDRAAIQKEVDQLTTELDRIATVTEFNTQKLLDGSFQNRVFHVGANKSQAIEVSVKAMSAEGIGLFGGSGSQGPAEINGRVTALNGSITALKGSVTTLEGSIKTLTGSIATLDGSVTTLKASVALNKASMKKWETHSNGLKDTIEDLSAQMEQAGLAGNTALVADLEQQINVKTQSLTTSNGYITTAKGKVDTAVGKIDTAEGKKVTATGKIALVQRGDKKLDFVNDKIKRKQNEVAELTDMLGSPVGAKVVNVSTQKSANRAIKTINEALTRVSDQRSTLGAIQNRLEHTIRNLDNAAENTQAAESRIRDIDMAKEMSEFTKKNILTQASQAMLAQANQLPQQVLQLLR